MTDTATEPFEAFCADLREAGLDAPWSRPGPLIALKPSAVAPHHWAWRDVETYLRQSASFVAPGQGADRRILRLANPGVPDRTATHSIAIAIQYLLPGEVAPAHRHTPGAIRFMIDGKGAYTTVEGRKCIMAPGDVVVTPSWSWHDHGNEGAAPVVWMDILDWPMVRFMENLAVETYDAERQPVANGEPDKDVFHRWDAALAALQERAATDSDDEVIVEYVAPSNGRSLLRMLGCYLQMLRPGAASPARRETSSALYHVVSGHGSTVIGDRRFDWGPRDFFAVPPNAPYRHETTAEDPAILFVVKDRPFLEWLGLYRAEPA